MKLSRCYWLQKQGIESTALALLLCIKNVCTVQVMQRTAEEIKENLTKYRIVPDVLSSYPKNAILVRYSEFVNADLGNELKYADIEEYVPLISWKADENKFYTLIMLDPDHPSQENPLNRCWNHWLVGNIPRHHVMMGEHIINYQETKPANNSGFHRYTTLVYEQPEGKIKFNESHLIEFDRPEDKVRAKFSASAFARKYNLGNPIGINFFKAKWAFVSDDDYEDD